MSKTTGIKFALALLTIAMCSAPTLSQASQFRGADGGTCLNMIDTDGDGIGDTRPERGTGSGTNAANFVDVDNDGVCDTYAAGGQQLLDGSGVPDSALQTQQQQRLRTRSSR
ncbi:MAG: hypothetical protein RBR22_08970 [Desulfuromonas sp.]|nr:hypothetical protein [Desulfuromonas sp.]